MREFRDPYCVTKQKSRALKRLVAMGAPLPVHRQAFSSWMDGLVGGHTSYNIFVATLRSHQATAFHSLHIYSLIVPHDALLEDDTGIADRHALWMLVRGFFFLVASCRRSPVPDLSWIWCLFGCTNDQL